MITDTILHKYMRHLRIMNGGYISLDAVEFALRLALEELDESTPSIPSTDVHTTEQLGAANLRIMELQADLERLQTDADTEIAALKAQLAQLDADNAAMIRRNKELADALHIAQNGTGLVIKNPPFVPLPHVTADAPPPSAISNQQSAISNQQSPINNSLWSDPATLTTLDDIAKDWWIGVAAGRHQWRTVPKPIQLRIVRQVLSYGDENGPLRMSDFDAIKPDWMPSASSHTQTLKLSWQQLNDWSIEL